MGDAPKGAHGVLVSPPPPGPLAQSRCALLDLGDGLGWDEMGWDRAIAPISGAAGLGSPVSPHSPGFGFSRRPLIGARPLGTFRAPSRAGRCRLRIPNPKLSLVDAQLRRAAPPPPARAGPEPGPPSPGRDCRGGQRWGAFV